jgi:uncharacterized protein involved in exopolysaccharide biosynthesis
MSALAKDVIRRGISHIPGRTHFLDVDVQDLREIRAVAAARIAELREELAVLEAELEVLDEALEENSPDGPARVEPASS